MKIYLELSELPDSQQIGQVTETLRSLITDMGSKAALSMEERRKQRTLGPRRLAYAEAANRYGRQYEHIMPRTFEASELDKRIDSHRELEYLEGYARHLLEKLEDLRMALGIDIMKYSKMVHDGLRANNAMNPAYDEALQDMNDFFKRVRTEEEEVENTLTSNTPGLPPIE